MFSLIWFNPRRLKAPKAITQWILTVYAKFSSCSCSSSLFYMIFEVFLYAYVITCGWLNVEVYNVRNCTGPV